ncbi:Calcium-binding protein 1 [Acipenser ruthenus]|uniref:Calcium-binding protein 1 n=1 Tax=Acipenser ruthenus TaxID=7906 RepID=A0A444UXY3_ACIRT|nr:Calcium-binding protein 1 [Acipenser ruthenus]
MILKNDPFTVMLQLTASLLCKWLILGLDVKTKFDTNGDGEISTAELREAMRKLLGQQVGHRDLEEILRDVDLNGDGHVDFEGETLQGLAASLTELSTGLRQKKWKTFVIEFQFLSCLSAEFVRMMSR